MRLGALSCTCMFQAVFSPEAKPSHTVRQAALTAFGSSPSDAGRPGPSMSYGCNMASGSGYWSGHGRQSHKGALGGQFGEEQEDRVEARVEFGLRGGRRDAREVAQEGVRHL